MTLKRVLLLCWLYFTLPFQALRRFTTMIAVLFVVLSLVFNVAALTITGVYTTVSKGLSAVGLSTVMAREIESSKELRRVQKSLAKSTSRRVVTRVQKGAVRSIGSVAGEAIPVIGVGVIAGALALEVQDACDTAKDMKSLEALLAADDNPKQAAEEASLDFDCVDWIREELPTFDELPSAADIWKFVLAAPKDAYQLAQQAGIAVIDYDWNGAAIASLSSLLRWADSTSEFFFSQDGRKEGGK